VTDALRPSSEGALAAWAARVRANREQVEQFREASPSDFYGGIAGMFRVDPYRRGEPTLEALRTIVRPEWTVLDIGVGGGRYALPLALICREVIGLDPSEAMLKVLRESLAEHAIGNVQVVKGRWPASDLSADVCLIAHLGYDVEDIGPFLDAMEAAARELCVAVLLEHPPPAEADRLWPLIHGVARAALPSLPEFLTLLLARGRLFELRLVERTPQSYEQPEQALAWLRGQLWTVPESTKDQRLQQLLHERIVQRDGRYALSWSPARVGIVTWRP
jgi:SAM-dependent methyltransferase